MRLIFQKPIDSQTLEKDWTKKWKTFWLSACFLQTRWSKIWLQFRSLILIVITLISWVEPTQLWLYLIRVNFKREKKNSRRKKECKWNQLIRVSKKVLKRRRSILNFQILNKVKSNRMTIRALRETRIRKGHTKLTSTCNRM